MELSDSNIVNSYKFIGTTLSSKDLKFTPKRRDREMAEKMKILGMIWN
jgi:hypothetical protein